MRIIKLIILTLFLFLSCYFIYIKTDNKNYFYVSLGDNNYYNNDNTFVNRDYRVIDVINILKYNKEEIVNNKLVSLHQILDKADILFLSIGMNDIYYFINNSVDRSYEYANKLINDIELLINLVNRYDYKYFFLFGLYNIYDSNTELFNYINYKLENICKSNNMIFVDLDNEIEPYMLDNIDNYVLNNNGYNEIYRIIKKKLIMSNFN